MLERRKIMELNKPFFVFLLSFIAFNSANVNAQGCQYGQVFNGTHCEKCGITFYSPNIKIVGGIIAVPNSWPSQVYIQVSYTTDYDFGVYGIKTISGTFGCGASLINHQTVLSAAHCIVTSFPYYYNNRQYTVNVTLNKYYPTWESMFKLYFGLHDTNDIDTNAPNVVSRNVEKIVKHPNYDDNNVLNDIALFILDKPLLLNNYIQLACLPKSVDYTYPSPNLACYAAGWGTLTEGGSSPNQLYNVKLTVYNSSYCSKVYPTIPKNFNAQVCAGEYNGGKDTCQGDSGGGLYVYDTLNNSQRYVVSGVVSYGDGCANAQKPGIYTRVSYYLPWILNNWKIIEPIQPPISSASGFNSFFMLYVISIVVFLNSFY